MKERPILFSAEMVRAILDGRKTQTRRVIKGDFYVENDPPLTAYIPSYLTGEPNPVVLPCPYGQVGERLWVRETWAKDVPGCEFQGGYAYRADHITGNDWPTKIKWKPSIYMPREASRITLEIVGVRVERLQDISEEDAIAEGVCELANREFSMKGGSFRSYEAANTFRQLWDSINEQHTWKSNPWVWVIDFKQVRN